MSVLNGDYIGFCFNGKHSSELGIVRISDGSRFNENLLPTIQDKTVQVPGRDGTYYFGSYYTQRQFNISFAFDSLTEGQFRELRTYLGTKKISPLIFDEAPYKEYQAKITGSATIKHICFDEQVYNEEIEDYEKRRVYKGEGSIQFTAYYPYARSVHKFLDQYVNISNINEWKDASGMREKGQNHSTKAVDIFNEGGFYVYNPGDIETDFILRIYFDNNKIGAGPIYMENSEGKIEFSEITKIGNDSGIQINTKINLIEGIIRNDKTGAVSTTGNIYNGFITKGDFFKIPIIREEKFIEKLYVNLSSNSNQLPEILYNYYYF